ncbi:hypothetical protein CBL_06163 [Carabus blaptoides fortunei]
MTQPAVLACSKINKGERWRELPPVSGTRHCCKRTTKADWIRTLQYTVAFVSLFPFFEEVHGQISPSEYVPGDVGTGPMCFCHLQVVVIVPSYTWSLFGDPYHQWDTRAKMRNSDKHVVTSVLNDGRTEAILKQWMSSLIPRRKGWKGYKDSGQPRDPDEI